MGSERFDLGTVHEIDLAFCGSQTWSTPLSNSQGSGIGYGDARQMRELHFKISSMQKQPWGNECSQRNHQHGETRGSTWHLPSRTSMPNQAPPVI